MKLGELAREIGGRLEGGSPDADITGVASLEEACPADLACFSHESYRERLPHTRAGAVILPPGEAACPAPCIVCERPALAFARAMSRLFAPRRPDPGISEFAVVEPGAHVGEGSAVGPFVFIGRNASIGNGTVIHPHVFIGENVVVGPYGLIHSHVSIREDCVIGERVILQNGCRIGSDGFGFAKDENDRHLKTPQVGRVVLGDDVEIGANSCVDRATFGETVIGRGTKTDNLVHVGHNVRVGEDTLLVAQVGIAGSCTIGDRVVLAGQAGVADHLSIGDDAVVGAKSGVTKLVPPGMTVVGFPAMEYTRWVRVQRFLQKRIRDVEDGE